MFKQPFRRHQTSDSKVFLPLQSTSDLHYTIDVQSTRKISIMRSVHVDPGSVLDNANSKLQETWIAVPQSHKSGDGNPDNPENHKSWAAKESMNRHPAYYSTKWKIDFQKSK